MTPRTALAIAALAALGLWAWRAELIPVARAGDRPKPLVLDLARDRTPVDLDVVLQAVGAGLQHLEPGEGVLLIHYWAPWERHGAVQAALLDSLQRLPSLRGLRVAVVCFDPFPSVARFVARHRLRLTVLFDDRRRLRRKLPCPMIPFTYVLDRSGRVAVAEAGEVDWFAERTRVTLERLLGERGTPGMDREVAPPS